ncbi:MAG: hypothetical protein ABL901_18315 [Hyphomicrobiaceae bacterium]
MSRNAQGVVAVVFTVLALSFIATTAVLYYEFQDHQWFTIAAFYSHLFIFFPTFGILALFAFFIPASALLDLYWSPHVPYGKIRFMVSTLLLAAVSLGISSTLITGVPAVWWLSPQTLAADKGRPENCAAPRCTRLPVMDSVAEVRRVSQHRAGLSPFARPCEADNLMEIPPEQLQKRQCFVTKTKVSAAECCMAQNTFNNDLSKLYADEPAHSVTGKIHAILLPLKVFFLLMVLSIGVLLAVWRRKIDKLYGAYTGRIERGLLVGAVAMLVWPVANHGFLLSSTLLYGKAGEGLYAIISPVLSFMFAAWALLLVLFFFRQHQRDIEAAGKIGGGIASAVAIIKYNEIIDYATRFIGSGADPWELSLMAVLIVGAFSALYIGLPVDVPGQSPNTGES